MRRHALGVRHWTALSCAAGLAASACSGQIDPGSPESANSRGSSAPTPTGTGASGASGDGSPTRPGDLAGGELDPGRVTLHRLNRVEYNNTVRDLLGTSLQPAEDFPADDRGYGFDNIADVLSLSPLQLEMYADAAETLVEDALAVTTVGARRFEAEAIEATTGAASGGAAWNLYSSGSVQTTVEIETAGRYRLAGRVWAQQAGGELARMSLDVDQLPVAEFEVQAEASTPAVYETTVELTPGRKLFGLSFLNDFWDEDTGDDRNLLVDWLELEGPLGVEASNPRRAAIVTCDPAADAPMPCIRQILEGFGRRAWRRPLSNDERDRLGALVQARIDAGDTVEASLRLALQAILLSPHFLFRVELDPDPTAEEAHPLSDHELAARLSYFLWSSMPDATLFELADAGMLQDDDVLRTQVRRMLADPKAQALVDNFAGQWLFLRALDDHTPDYQAFPDFDDELRGSMRTETRRFFETFLQGEVGMDQLLTADFSFINDRLARHYGMAEVGGGFERVSLAGQPRQGLLTQASILTVTSYPTRTSPVRRGSWVLEQLLCEAPPPPPPGVEGLMDEVMPSGSLRERFEAHRADPACAGCHQLMDPIGFAFEHYDGIGGYRQEDQGYPIDASGMLPDGTPFDDAAELAQLLDDDPRLPRCIAEHLYVYALGRGPEAHDDPHLDALAEAFVGDGWSLPKLIEHIVLSAPFRMRRGSMEGGEP